MAGTGISGALAIAGAFTARNRDDLSFSGTWRRLIIVWSVRASDVIDLPLKPTDGLEVRTHLTGGVGHERLDIGKTLRNINDGAHDAVGRTWCYISGPEPFIRGAEEACRATAEHGFEMEVYSASWAP